MNATYLAEAVPPLRRIRLRRLPLDRDQLMLLVAAFNELMLGVETYLAHLISGTIVPREWIPILFGPIAAVLLVIAGLVAFKNRMAANILATLTFLASIVVGVLGSYYHLVRAILPNAPAGQQVNLPLLVWAPPMLAPIMFALIGILGMSAAWQEEHPGSGVLVLPFGGRLRMPYSKTRAYFWVVAVGTLFTVLSSVLDHARSGLENPWTWLPLVVGAFTFFVSLAMGFFPRLYRNDLQWYLAAVVLMLLVGVIGVALHINFDLIRGREIVQERFIRGAPLLAPLLFANMGLIGLLVLFADRE